MTITAQPPPATTSVTHTRSAPAGAGDAARAGEPVPGFATLVGALTAALVSQGVGTAAEEGSGDAGTLEAGAHGEQQAEPAAAGELAGAALAVALLGAAVPVPPPATVTAVAAVGHGAAGAAGAALGVDPAAPVAVPAPGPSTDLVVDLAGSAPVATPADGATPAGSPIGDARLATDGAADTNAEVTAPVEDQGPDVGASPDPDPGQPGDRPSVASNATPAFALPGTTPTGTVAPLSALDAVSATTEPVRPAPPALSEQLVSVVAPFRRASDGTHQLSLQLRPEELGGLHVDVRVLGNQISLHLSADLPATTDLLRANLDELRAELEAAGFDAGSLDVGAREQRRPEHDRSGASPAEGTSVASASVAIPRSVLGTTTTTAAGLDIRL